MLKLLARVIVCYAIIVCGISHSNAQQHLYSAQGSDSLANVDKFFVTQYMKLSRDVGQSTYPLLLIQGFNFTLYVGPGKSKTFSGPVRPFNELKAISHVGPTLYSIGAQHWRNPEDKTWLQAVSQYNNILANGLSHIKDVNWNNEAWPGKGDALASFMHDSLQMVSKQVQHIVNTGEFTKEDYKAFSSRYLHTMTATMYLADLANTTFAVQRLTKWKQEIGLKQWDKLNVVVMGSKGRTTAGLTVKTNTAATMIASLMKPKLVKENIIITPMAMDTKTALSTLGFVVNAKDLAEATFQTKRARELGGLYKALNDPKLPLAIKNVKSIVTKLNTHKKAKLPRLSLYPQDK